MFCVILLAHAIKIQGNIPFMKEKGINNTWLIFLLGGLIHLIQQKLDVSLNGEIVAYPVARTIFLMKNEYS